MCRHAEVIRAVREDRTQTDEDGHRITPVLMGDVQAGSRMSPSRLPGRRELHTVLAHSSARLRGMPRMQPIPDPDVNVTFISNGVYS